MENASFSWESTAGVPALRDINLKINAGNLVAVVGSVGAGKSSLISAFLGETYKICGYVNTKVKHLATPFPPKRKGVDTHVRNYTLFF